MVSALQSILTMSKHTVRVGVLTFVVACMASIGVASLVAANTSRTFDVSVARAYDHVQKETRMASRLFSPGRRALHGVRHEQRSGS